MSKVIDINQYLWDKESHEEPLDPNWDIDNNDYILWKARQENNNITVLPITNK